VYDFYTIKKNLYNGKNYFTFASALKTFRQQSYMNKVIDSRVECSQCGLANLKIKRKQVGSYIKINSSILYCFSPSSFYEPIVCREIKNIDANSFKISGNYLKDKNGIYYAETTKDNDKKVVKMDNVEIASFKVLNIIYAKDKNNVYCEGQIMKEADPVTFYLRDSDGVSYRSADKNNKYQYCDIYKE